MGWVLADVIDDLLDDDPSVARGVPETARPAAGGHLRFRPWRASDVDVYVALLDNPAVWTFLPEDYPAPLTRELALDLIEISSSLAHHEVRAIEHEGVVVGQVRLLFDREDTTQAELSYWLGEPHWGKGIISRALPRYIDQALRAHPRLSSLIARVHADNAASLRAAERAGFVFESREDQVLILRRRRPGAVRAVDAGEDTADLPVIGASPSAPRPEVECGPSQRA